MSTQVILFLAANPHGTQPVKLDSECAAIQRELKLARHRDDFRFESRWAVSIDDLMRHLRELDPTVIHFSGHGGGSSGLMLEDEQGQPQPISARALTKIVAATTRRVRLVVLNACYSAVQAQALCTGVDCVVGMAGAIGDVEARRFAVQFYGALGDRRSIGNAVANGVAVLAAYELPDETLPHCVTRRGVDAQKVFLATIGGDANAVVQVANPPANPTISPAAAAGAPIAAGAGRTVNRTAAAVGVLVATIVVAVLALRGVGGSQSAVGNTGSDERNAGSAAKPVPAVAVVPADAKPDPPVTPAPRMGSATGRSSPRPEPPDTDSFGCLQLVGRYNVKFDSAPPGAAVYLLNDESCGPVGYTPLEGEINAGDYTVAIGTRGYETATKPFRVARVRTTQELFVPLVKKLDPPLASAVVSGGAVGLSNLPDGLDREMISDSVDKVKAQALACGDKSPAKGQVKVSVQVAPDGSVANVTVRNTPDPELGNCVAGVMRQAKFARTQTGGSFAYPFQF